MKLHVETVDSRNAYLLAIGPHGRVVARAAVSYWPTCQYERESYFEQTARVCSFLATKEGKAARKVASELGPMLHYKALCAASKKHGLPLAYHADLTVHDRFQLSGNPNADPFGWIVRENGTHLFYPTREGNRDGFRYLATCFAPGSWSDQAMLFFWWDGSRLIELANVASLVDRLTCALFDIEHPVKESECA